MIVDLSAPLNYSPSQSMWNLHLRKPLNILQIELSSLLSLLHNFQIQQSCLDRRIWSFSSSGSFTVSFYFVALSSPNDFDFFPYKRVWTSLAPSEVQGFIWKMEQGALSLTIESIFLILISLCAPKFVQRASPALK